MQYNNIQMAEIEWLASPNSKAHIERVWRQLRVLFPGLYIA